ncbi:MFS transporter [Ramlibacter rhizophilus]|uniref:MFS transporter n=2 Tax=Ramlibacter rhizophilus TaxID=1781167 RepID=A0A4Z0BS58_9BURK|nr:MFS transporter [Ramlibacter rhizophilus]
MRLGIGPFFLPITEDLGFSRSVLAGIVAVGMIVYGLGMPLAGWLVGRWGTATVLTLGVAIVAVSVAWAVNTSSAQGFLWSFGVLMSVGLAFTSPVAMTPVISRWFTRQRGMALFFLSTGSMAGMAVMTPVLAAAIEAYGWRIAMIGFAAALTAFALPAAWLVVRDQAPEHTDLRPEDIATRPATAPSSQPAPGLRHAIATVPFWNIALGLFACGFSMNLLGTHGVPMLMDHGFDAHSSSLGIGLIGLVAIFGTLVLGRLSDRMPKRQLLAAIYGVRGIGFFVLVAVGTHWELYTAASIGGIVWAGSIALSSAILADVYGVRLVGVLYGLTYLSHQLGGMVSAWLGGWAYEAYGTHWIAFGSAGVLLLGAAAVSLQLPRAGAGALRTA